MTYPEWIREMGVVRHKRWLAWGHRHGLMIRPHWLAEVIVDSWNWVSCHTLGHEWYPDYEAADGTIVASTSHEFCPNCDAKRPVS